MSIGIGRWLIAPLSAWSFPVYASVACAWTLLLVGWVGLRIWRSRYSSAGGGADGPPLKVLPATSAASSTLTLVAKVPSRDDYYYAPNPVHDLSRPAEAMGYSIHGLVSNTSELFTSIHWSTAIAFEYLQAAWAYGLDVHFLTVYHTLTPVILAALVPWILYGLLCVWRPATAATALAVAATVLVLLCMGDALRAPGNYDVADNNSDWRNQKAKPRFELGEGGVTRALLAEIRDESERRGSALVIFAIPSKGQFYQGEAHHPCQRCIEALCRELRIEYHDLAPALEASRLRTYFRFGKHWTPRGHAVAAAAIEDALFGAPAGDGGQRESAQRR
jgi:hypothetical protein